jgi:hypothetical protein
MSALSRGWGHTEAILRTVHGPHVSNYELPTSTAIFKGRLEIRISAIRQAIGVGSRTNYYPSDRVCSPSIQICE